MTNWKKLRQQIREARAGVPKKYAQQASYKFSELIGEMDWYQRATKVAGFLPFEGEADPLPLMDRAIQDGKRVFVPIIIAKGQPLKFAAWTRNTPTSKNGFGIDQPDVPRESLIEAHELDFVITPLVACDDRCNRLGVGGGFYDRSFAFLNELEGMDARPTRLVGIAYELQVIDRAPTEDWDVRLDAVATETGLRLAGSS